MQVAVACSRCMCFEPRNCLSKGVCSSFTLLGVSRVSSDGPTMCGSRIEFALRRLLLLLKDALNFFAEVLRDHLILQRWSVLDQEILSFKEDGSIEC